MGPLTEAALLKTRTDEGLFHADAHKRRSTAPPRSPPGARSGQRSHALAPNPMVDALTSRQSLVEVFVSRSVVPFDVLSSFDQTRHDGLTECEVAILVATQARSLSTVAIAEEVGL